MCYNICDTRNQDFYFCIYCEVSMKMVNKVVKPKPKSKSKEMVKVDITQQQTLEELENQMLENIEKERRLWVITFEIMAKIDRKELYKEAGFSSFTAWVNSFAIKANLHVSLLWKRYKAGKYYEAFEERARNSGINVPTMEKIEIGAETLVLIEKIAGKNDVVGDELTQKALSGEMKQSDLKAAYQAVKTEKADKVEKKADSIEEIMERQGQTKLFTDINTDTKFKVKIKAEDVVKALQSRQWLLDLLKGTAGAETGYGETGKYVTFTEFPAFSADTRHSRRMDILAIETMSINGHEKYDVKIHGIEVKVSESDLKKDTKMGEYVNLVDMFWVAVPDTPKMLETAQNYIIKGWGLLAFSKDHQVRVVTQATYNKGVLRDKTLVAALLKCI